MELFGAPLQQVGYYLTPLGHAELGSAVHQHLMMRVSRYTAFGLLLLLALLGHLPDAVNAATDSVIDVAIFAQPLPPERIQAASCPSSRPVMVGRTHTVRNTDPCAVAAAKQGQLQPISHPVQVGHVHHR